MQKVHFVDINGEFIDAASKIFSENNQNHIEYSSESIETIPIENKAFVSPGNSLGFMDGGIDFVYSRKMFPGVEGQIREMIKGLSQEKYLHDQNINLVSKLGRPYLTVGSAICQFTGNNTCLIACPTMFLPHDVSKTQNAYHAFMAGLMAVNKINAKRKEKITLVCPALCCGYGKMSYEESALQIYNAYVDFHNNKIPVDYSKWKNIVITDSRDEEQPNNYDNREIKDIDVTLL
jgi:O-acetyl-ADP-ribose deacetylase (regulator of RNase III)